VRCHSRRNASQVGPTLAVKGVGDGSVWALGDCAVAGCAPTAQAASQQGKYLGRLFRDTKLDPAAIAAYPPFQVRLFFRRVSEAPFFLAPPVSGLYC